jgi:murein DD-endopeptidase MepM/ murein hydrolase activator NlpD
VRRAALYLCITLLILAALSGGVWYAKRRPPDAERAAPAPPAVSSTPLIIPISDGFDYPIGGYKRVTQANDGDGWYNARDFGESNHLGEDWNKESGGNTDCGLPVYAVSRGTIILAVDAGAGWGKVLIVRHRLPDGSEVETLYGHLNSMARTSGDVRRRETIGSIGDAGGVYPCHLHFELRLSGSRFWGLTGLGYSPAREGWTDPSDFIDARRNL